MRNVDARARAADLLVQLATRGVRAVHGARDAAGDRSRAGRARPEPLDHRRGAGAVVGERVELLRADDAGDRRPVRGRPRGAVGGAERRAPEPFPPRDRGGTGPGDLQESVRPATDVRSTLRGDPAEPRAAVHGDRLGVDARADRGVHERPAVPGVRGGPAAAGVAVGADRGNADPRVHGAVGPAGARSGSRRSSCRPPTGTSRG